MCIYYLFTAVRSQSFMNYLYFLYVNFVFQLSLNVPIIDCYLGVGVIRTLKAIIDFQATNSSPKYSIYRLLFYSNL